MDKLDINKLELPEFDIIKAAPVSIPMDDIGRRKLEFIIPNCNDYFTFEAHYLKILRVHFKILSNVQFLNLKEFQSMKLKKMMISQLRPLQQSNLFMRDFIGLIKKYFKANFRISSKTINPLQLPYLFLLVHKVVETVKKKFQEFLKATDAAISPTLATSSIFLSGISQKIEPRF